MVERGVAVKFPDGHECIVLDCLKRTAMEANVKNIEWLWRRVQSEMKEA